MSQPQNTLLGSAPRRTSRVGREAASEQHDMSQERWLLTYADMITLLLVLFIVLFALSKINQAKYRQFQQSVSHVKLVGSSVAHGSTSVPSRGPAPLSASSDHLRQIEQVLSHALALKGLLGRCHAHHRRVRIGRGPGGRLDLLPDRLGSSCPRSATRSSTRPAMSSTRIRTMSTWPATPTTRRSPAGPTPTTGRCQRHGPRPWSSASPRLMVSNPERVVAIGYGQYHPVVPNTSATAQAENRRVNIVVSRQSTPGSSAAQ